MRFLKLTGAKGDVLHVWIEDDCPTWIWEGVRDFLADKNSSIEGSSGHFPRGFKLTERLYAKKEVIDAKPSEKP